MAQGSGAQHVLPATLSPVSSRCFTAVCSPDSQSLTASAKGFIFLAFLEISLASVATAILMPVNIRNHLRQTLLGDAVQSLLIGGQNRSFIAILSGCVEVTSSGKAARVYAPQ